MAADRPSEGRIVISTFTHVAAETICLYLDGLEEPIRCTPNHITWSPEQKDVGASDNTGLRALVVCDENVGSVIGGQRLKGEQARIRLRLPVKVDNGAAKLLLINSRDEDVSLAAIFVASGLAPRHCSCDYGGFWLFPESKHQVGKCERTIAPENALAKSTYDGDDAPLAVVVISTETEISQELSRLQHPGMA